MEFEPLPVTDSGLLDDFQVIKKEAFDYVTKELSVPKEMLLGKPQGEIEYFKRKYNKIQQEG